MWVLYPELASSHLAAMIEIGAPCLLKNPSAMLNCQKFKIHQKICDPLKWYISVCIRSDGGYFLICC